MHDTVPEGANRRQQASIDAYRFALRAVVARP